MPDNALTVIPAANGHEAALMPALTLEAAIARKQQIVKFVQAVMIKGHDYGTVPGVKKNILFKPGAERLCSYFALRPTFEFIDRTENWGSSDGLDEPLFSYMVKCRLWRGGEQVGEGDANCNSRETKYRYRQSDRKCPKCGEPTILRSKYDDKGWYCFAKKGGCGEKFAAKDAAIVDQATGRTLNLDVADQLNTIIKMAEKRALIAAVLIAVNASEFFTQDMEDFAASPPTNEEQAVAAAEKVEAKNNQAAEKTAERTVDIEKMISAISGLKEKLKQLEPVKGEGELTYYDTLWNGYGAKHANSKVFQNQPEQARACYRELTRKLNEWKRAATLGVTAEDLEPESPETSDEIAERKLAELRREKGEPALTVKDFDNDELWLIGMYLKNGLGVGPADKEKWLDAFKGTKGELLARAEKWRDEAEAKTAVDTGDASARPPAAPNQQGGLGW